MPTVDFRDLVQRRGGICLLLVLSALAISPARGFDWSRVADKRAPTERVPATAEAIPQRTATGWDPAHTLVFVAGILEWKDSQTFESFPRTDRRDAQLVDFFQKAGVPAEHLVYVKDKRATLAALRASLKELLARSTPEDTLILYYTGHGFPDDNVASRIFFAPYDAGEGKLTGWRLGEIVETVEESFQGDRALLMADCCCSGGLIDAVKSHGSRVKYACLASAKASESSTGNWTFTEAVLRGLRGDPTSDLDGDGVITLEEIQGFAAREMAFGEDQKTASLSQGAWGESFPMATAAKSGVSHLGAHVEAKSEGDWYKGWVTVFREGKYRIFYYGYEKTDVEWVKPSAIRWARE